MGLSYICATAERCYAVGAVLGSMVQMLVRVLPALRRAMLAAYEMRWLTLPVCVVFAPRSKSSRPCDC